MFGYLKQYQEIQRLNALEVEMGSARIKHASSCLRCGHCCVKRSCVPSPEELKTIAGFLKMEILPCINKYFAIDTLDDETYFLKPLGINISDLGGKFIPSWRTFHEGACVFLEKVDKIYTCKIYPVRPRWAKLSECWKKEDQGPSPEEDLKEMWGQNKLKTEFGIDSEKAVEESYDD